MTIHTPQVRRRGLHRDVVNILGQRIVRGDFRPGTSLPNESDLGATLDVSRTVVREAVKVLAAKGLLESRPKIGTRILDRTHWNLIDPDVLSWRVDVAADLQLFRHLSEVRSIIEPRAASLAAARRTEDEAAGLAELVRALDAVADDPDRYIPIDLELHAAILRATHNELLAHMTGTIAVALAASRRITVKVPGGPRSAMDLHRDVVAGIQAADAERASQAMEALIAGAARDIERVFPAATGRNGADGSS